MLFELWASCAIGLDNVITKLFGKFFKSRVSNLDFVLYMPLMVIGEI